MGTWHDCQKQGDRRKRIKLDFWKRKKRNKALEGQKTTSKGEVIWGTEGEEVIEERAKR